MKLHSEITAVEVLTVRKLTQHGAAAIAAEGTAKSAAAPVDVRLVGVQVEDHAVAAVAYVPQQDEKNYRLAGDILKSLRTEGKPSERPKFKPESVATTPSGDPARDLSTAEVVVRRPLVRLLSRVKRVVQRVGVWGDRRAIRMKTRTGRIRDFVGAFATRPCTTPRPSTSRMMVPARPRYPK